MSVSVDLTVLAGALLGGFVSGLAGFGNALVALGVWLYVLPPTLAAPLVALCAVIAQAQTLRTIWHAIDFRHVWPMLLAGVLGVPIGVALLPHADPRMFRAGVGVLLVVLSSWLLFGRPMSIAWGGRAADAAVGVCGGILGGLSGLSGPLPTLWATLRGWGKDRRRGVFQIYNLVVLMVAFGVQMAEGVVGRSILPLAAAALPGTVLGAWIGARAYRRLSDHHFHRVLLAILGASGLSLVWSNLLR